jgi:hypothetical protein
MKFSIYQGRWSQGAIAKAINRLQRDPAIGPGRPKRCAEYLLGMRHQRLATDCLTGFGPTQFDHMPASRGIAEIMIKGEHAMDFGPG